MLRHYAGHVGPSYSGSIGKPAKGKPDIAIGHIRRDKSFDGLGDDERENIGGRPGHRPGKRRV